MKITGQRNPAVRQAPDAERAKREAVPMVDMQFTFPTELVVHMRRFAERRGMTVEEVIVAALAHFVGEG